MCETVTEWRVAPGSYLKGAALSWLTGFMEKKAFFSCNFSIQFLLQIFPSISVPFHFLQPRKPMETKVKGSILLKSQSSMLTDGTAITEWWGVSGHHLGWGSYPAATGRHTQAVGCKLRWRCPYVSVFRGQKGRPSPVSSSSFRAVGSSLASRGRHHCITS